MPTPTTYTYQLSATANSAMDSGALYAEILASATVPTTPDNITARPTDFDVTMQDALIASEKTALDALIAAHTGVPLPNDEAALSANKRMEVEVFKPRGSALTVVSHNFCDPATWFTNSVRLEALEISKAPEDSDYDVFRIGYQNLIDLQHGRYPREDGLCIAGPYCVKVEFDLGGIGTWVEKTEGVDYLIDHARGNVYLEWVNPFDPTGVAKLGYGPLTAADKVRVSFSYTKPHSASANASLYKLTPAAGKKIIIEQAWIKRSRNLTMRSPIVFEPWGGGAPVSGADIVYKGGQDFAARGGASGVYEPFGGNPRHDGAIIHGFTQPIDWMKFDYLHGMEFKASQLAELHIYTRNHTALIGELACVLLQCSVESE